MRETTSETLDGARNAFEAAPSHVTAEAYRRVAAEYALDGIIERDTLRQIAVETAAEIGRESGYRCPDCYGTDRLRAEVPAVVTLEPDGTCTLETPDAVTGDVGDLTPSAYDGVHVICDECGHEGGLPAFVRNGEPIGAEGPYSPLPRKDGEDGLVVHLPDGTDGSATLICQDCGKRYEPSHEPPLDFCEGCGASTDDLRREFHAAP